MGIEYSCSEQNIVRFIIFNICFVPAGSIFMTGVVLYKNTPRGYSLVNKQYITTFHINEWCISFTAPLTAPCIKHSLLNTFPKAFLPKVWYFSCGRGAMHLHFVLRSGDSGTAVQERWCSVSINLSGSGSAVERWEATAAAAAAELAAVWLLERLVPPSFNVRQKAKLLIILWGDVNIMLFITIWVLVQVTQASYKTDEWQQQPSQGFFLKTFSDMFCLWHVFHRRVSVIQRYLFLTPSAWFWLAISSRLLSPPAPLMEGGR